MIKLRPIVFTLGLVLSKLALFMWLPTLLALFTGSEGMLGIVTEVTVKLLPKPQVAKVLLAAFDSVEKAGRAVGDIIAAGIIPGGLEMMDNLSIRAA